MNVDAGPGWVPFFLEGVWISWFLFSWLRGALREMRKIIRENLAVFAMFTVQKGVYFYTQQTFIGDRPKTEL